MKLRYLYSVIYLDQFCKNGRFRGLITTTDFNRLICIILVTKLIIERKLKN